MNKKDFIEALSSELSYSKDDCIIINEVLEKNFFISKKNKDKIIDDLIKTLDIDNDKALHIYDTATIIIKDEVKEQLKHPFRSKD